MIYIREASPLFNSPLVSAPSNERGRKMKRGAKPLLDTLQHFFQVRDFSGELV